MVANDLFDLLVIGKKKIAVIGLGYVGLPLAMAFSEKGFNVLGFDVNSEKINVYKKGIDPTNEVGKERLAKSTIRFSSNPDDLKEVSFYIIAVPTPVLKNKIPDLRPIESASKVVGSNLSRGSIVVYESTVYPGVTEDICLPILEQESGMKCGVDFKIGYSPERVNPGDKEHRVETITKITSGMDEQSADIIARVYGSIVKTGIHKASSIKVAEAAKVIENSQRDINIAFVNELAMIFDRLGIDTRDVLEAAGTKWNFLKFSPGLVGGHCIGVDPYYLANKAEESGYIAQVILAGRRINDGMGKFIAEKTIKRLINSGSVIKGAHVLILGLTFKEDCPDIRNSKVEDIVNELSEYDITVSVVDPLANSNEAQHEYGIQLADLEKVHNVDAVILAVGHKEFKKLDLNHLKSLYKAGIKKPVLMDVKGIFDKAEANELGFDFWRM